MSGSFINVFVAALQNILNLLERVNSSETGSMTLTEDLSARVCEFVTVRLLSIEVSAGIYELSSTLYDKLSWYFSG